MKRIRLALPPALLALLLGVLTVGCSSGDTAPADPAQAAVSAAESSTLTENIPVEALPDPLPTPYLFRDEVTIETPTVTETIYVVQPGDTLNSIATQFCITLEEIQRLNNIVDVTSLSVGQELRIPIREGGCGAAAPASATADDSADDAPAPQRLPGEGYIVQAGDTLSAIASAFGLTWIDLMNYNGLTEGEAAGLQVGQSLIIPPVEEPVEEPAAEEEQAEPPG